MRTTGNFYKVEKWTKDGSKIERMLYAGSNLDKARKIFVTTVKHRPRIKLTIRQQTRVLQRTPDERAGPLKDSAASAGPSARTLISRP